MKDKRLLFAIISFLALGFYLAAISGCGTNSSGSATLSSITISPTVATVEAGTTEVFSATGTYSDSTTAALTPTWSVSGSIGTISSIGLNGLFTATTAGSGSVTATCSGKSASASVTVTGSSLTTITTIEISPSTATKRVSQSQTLVATAKNSSGTSISFTPAWSISGDTIGVLTSSGAVATLSASALGTATISCSASSITGTAFLTCEGYVFEVTAEADTYVDAASSSTAYGTSLSLKGGRTTSQTYEAYIKFNLAAVTPAITTVESAVLNIYATSATGTVNLKRVTTTWNGNTTWNTKPTLGTLITTNSFASGASTVDITSTEAQYWLDNTLSNFGLAIEDDSTDTGSVTFVSTNDATVDSRRPKLKIEYR
ncbi:MAG: DNRLRE domain-containing protein [Candidatus Saganbacteria bacterium]|nr:DNRLRE domain-containing protein [Candidatus Saganbacteria bacterium]